VSPRNNLSAWLGGDQLVQAVATQNNNTMVVINAVGPIILEPWIDNPNVTAVVWAGLGGTEVGNALVDVMYGAQNPSGRLPYTIAKSPDDYPEQPVDPGSGEEIFDIVYAEGLFVDYRHFDAANIAPRFEFGFGLSYTTFEYSALNIKVVDSGGPGRGAGEQLACGQTLARRPLGHPRHSGCTALCSM